MAKSYVIHAEPGHVGITGGDATLWLSSTFAPNWFEDATQEAKNEQGRSGLRREIIFAVCAVESYLVEWARDQVLGGKLKRLARYLPSDDRRGIWQRWKEVPKSLKADGLIRDTQDLSGMLWTEFTELIELRDGLVHARASRPDAGRGTADRPRPSHDDWGRLKHGWAATTIAGSIQELNRAAGTAAPTWAAYP